LTFHFVLLGWIFFRAANMTAAFNILKQIGSPRYSFANSTPAFLFILAFAAAAHFVPRGWYNNSILVFARAPALVQAGALTLLAVTIRYVAATGATPFIYSKF